MRLPKSREYRDSVEPSTSRGRETKSRIVAAAAELMHRRGVATTSVDDVLAASGTGKSQFYHYFSAKDDLVEAVLEHQLAGVLAEQRRFDIGTWQGIRGWLDSLLAGQAKRGFYAGCPLGSIVAELADRDERLQTLAAEAFTRWEAELADGLRLLQSRGRLDAEADPDTLAEGAMATIQGGYLLSTTKKNLEPMNIALDAALARITSHSTAVEAD